MDAISAIVIEDNDTMRLGIQDTLERDGLNVKPFGDPVKALEEFAKEPVPIVITDLRMEPMSGMDVLKRVKSIESQTEVLLISAYGTVQTAVEAMQHGAVDFLTKPFSPEELRIRIKRITDNIKKDNKIEKLEAEREYYRDELMHRYDEMIGTSAEMKAVFDLIDRVSMEESVVLIEGESGTGKELVARAIHRKSLRKEGPFIRVNCGALNDNLLESELFGHEKGAFTGAIRTRQGRFELADGGTLFLDEIGDISAVMQVKLLRALQEKEFERVGGEKTIKTDVRIIAATNRDLGTMISEQKFREDLYYRLNVIPIKLPPLRDRIVDIPLLTQHFMDKLNRNRNSSKTISEEAIELLKYYSWPGNIRELENLIERLCVISSDSEIQTELITHFLGQKTISLSDYKGMRLNNALESFEKNLIIHALKKANGIKQQAARLLDIKTSTLYYKMEKFGMMK